MFFFLCFIFQLVLCSAFVFFLSFVINCWIWLLGSFVWLFSFFTFFGYFVSFVWMCMLYCGFFVCLFLLLPFLWGFAFIILFFIPFISITSSIQDLGFPIGSWPRASRVSTKSKTLDHDRIPGLWNITWLEVSQSLLFES